MTTSLMTWDPWRELAGIRREIDRMFNEAFVSTGRPLRNLPFDLFETPDEVVAKVALPGVRANDVDLSVEQGVLHIRGQFPAFEEDPDKAAPTWHYRGLWQGQFALDVALPAEVRAEDATASMNDGILEIHLPKAEWARRRRIEVKVNA